MDMEVKNSGGYKKKLVLDVKKVGESEEEELRSLLSPPAKGAMAKTPRKARQKVQWRDTNGNNKLVEVLEFQPSDTSDNDEEDLDSCICTIM
ncbi:hypothetical protein GIB67_030255 [Kingdonia uniflora]|uniref:Uncharacterized protein n=1 Tax=Kingdonia uniflora TaxID=39325 RepID=A0A7J7MNB7_9MAGN|nr:hypothetical protein GIB67_030255 [Kingdonia uniflora]